MARKLPPRSERVQPRERLANDERVDLVGAFVGVHALEVEHVPDDGILEQDAVAPEDCARAPSDFERLTHVVALAERDLCRQELALAFVLQASVMEREQLTFDD